VSLFIDKYLFAKFSWAFVSAVLVALFADLYIATYALHHVCIEHRKVDHAFSAASRECTSMFENVLDGILILDNEANCLDANPAAASILRVPPDELIGKSVRSFSLSGDEFTNKWRSFLQRSGQRGRAELIAGDGTRVFVDFTAAAHYLPGRHIFIFCDATERNRAEKALRDSEERFRHMANNIQEIFWMMDAETLELVYVNRAYSTITGHSVQSLQANPFSYRELIHPEDRVRVLPKLHEIRSSGKFDEAFRFTRADGTVRWIWVKGFPVQSKGETRWVVGTAQDITSRKQAETKIIEQLEAVEAARAEAEALRKSTLALSENLSMDAVLDTLLECMSELVPFDRATVLFVENGTEVMVAREVPHGAQQRIGLTLRIAEHTFLDRMLAESRAILIPEVAKEAAWRDVQPLDHLQSWLAVPLISGGRVLGILSLGATAPGVLTTEHLRLAKSLAIPAAVAIQNARTHQRAEIYAVELEIRLRELNEPQSTIRRVDDLPGH
jgi:PAS domain S-box-containing protein